MSTTILNTEDKEFKFIEKLRDYYIIQHITEPTRGRGTTEPSLLGLEISSEDSEIVLIETASVLGKIDQYIPVYIYLYTYIYIYIY